MIIAASSQALPVTRKNHHQRVASFTTDWTSRTAVAIARLRWKKPRGAWYPSLRRIILRAAVR
jgi:hypothetical protein